MQSDEQQIRELISTWMTATQAGDVDKVLSLMTDDVVFLLPGRAPMRKDEFAALSRPPTDKPSPTVTGTSEIKEIQISGDWAFMWTHLSVKVTPPDGSSPMERAGHTLTVLQRVNGKWLLARDANLLTPVQR
jgi:uncharacterized protein (TIGR02246 family)